MTYYSLEQHINKFPGIMQAMYYQRTVCDYVLIDWKLCFVQL